jgi:hypothetical protein
VDLYSLQIALDVMGMLFRSRWLFPLSPTWAMQWTMWLLEPTKDEIPGNSMVILDLPIFQV